MMGKKVDPALCLPNCRAVVEMACWWGRLVVIGTRVAALARVECFVPIHDDDPA